MTNSISKATAAVVLLFVCSAAQSAPVTWQIDVTLPEGGTVTGSFIFDASTGSFTGVNASAVGDPFDTLASPPGSSASLTGVIADESFAGAIDLIPAAGGDLTNVTDVFLDLASDMTDSGGTISVDYVLIFECLDFDCLNYTELYNSENSNGGGFIGVGTVSTVPIPAAAWLFGSALGLLGWVRRRTV